MNKQDQAKIQKMVTEMLVDSGHKVQSVCVATTLDAGMFNCGALALTQRTPHWVACYWAEGEFTQKEAEGQLLDLIESEYSRFVNSPRKRRGR